MPLPPGGASAHANVTIVSDVPFATPAGHPLFADLHLPAGLAAPAAAIIWIHGGGWRSGNRRLGPDLSRFFAACGFATIAVDYRLSGRAIFPAQIEDVKTAIRWVRSVAAAHHIDAGRIGLWGASSGGHLAALAGLAAHGCFTPDDGAYCEYSSDVQAVVCAYPPVDFLQMDAHRPSPGTRSEDPHSLLLPRLDMRSEDADSYESLLMGAPIATCPERVRGASPLTYARAGAPPFLILHGSCDTTVAPQQSEALYQALARFDNDVTLAVVDGLGHGFLNRTALDAGGPRQMQVAETSRGGRTTSVRAPVFATIEAFFRRTLVS